MQDIAVHMTYLPRPLIIGGFHEDAQGLVKIRRTKVESLQEDIILFIHLFVRAILLMKKLKIEETKAT